MSYNKDKRIDCEFDPPLPERNTNLNKEDKEKLKNLLQKYKNKPMSEKEYEALEEKLNNPQKTVKCPRCGNDIIYEKRGNSIAIECKTRNCIFGGIRGL